MSNEPNIDLEQFKGELINQLVDLFGDFFYVEPSELLIHKYNYDASDLMKHTNELIEGNDTLASFEYGTLFIVSLACAHVKLGVDFPEFRIEALILFRSLLKDGLKDLMDSENIKEIKKILSKKKVPKFKLRKSAMGQIKIGDLYSFEIKKNQYNKIPEDHYLIGKYIVVMIIGMDKSYPIAVVINQTFDNSPTLKDISNPYNAIIYINRYSTIGICGDILVTNGCELEQWTNSYSLIGRVEVPEYFSDIYKAELHYFYTLYKGELISLRSTFIPDRLQLFYNYIIQNGYADFENHKFIKSTKQIMKDANDGIYNEFLDYFE